MNSIFISLVYIIFVVALHQYLKNNYPSDLDDLRSVPTPKKHFNSVLKNKKVMFDDSNGDFETESVLNTSSPTSEEGVKTDYKTNLLNVFSDNPMTDSANKQYTDPFKQVNPDYSELDKYYSDLNNETYSFEPVPLLKDNTEKKFKTQLLGDARSDLNHEIVYDNIMAFEDFEASYAPLS
jgi:hypothetical protein